MYSQNLYLLGAYLNSMRSGEALQAEKIRSIALALSPEERKAIPQAWDTWLIQAFETPNTTH